VSGPLRSNAVIIRKTPEQIEQMAAAGAIQARCLKMLASKCRPGVTTAELDEAADRFIAAQGAQPSFKGYRGFPGSICASPNSMVVHGIPGAYALKRGDVIALDVGVTKDGWVADAAITVPVGPVNPEARRLLDATRGALFAGAEQVRPGNHLGDVSAAIQGHVESEDFSIIRSLVGHGIGRDMHEDPQIPNYGERGRGPRLEPGMVLAIEPMVNAGGPNVRVGEDNWAVYSADGSLAAHYEFTVAVTDDGPRILTPWHEE
jgi:methionyl aminopeptidase